MRTLPDYLRRGMKLVIVGCNPGEQSARVGHYYAGRNNAFWNLLYESGIVGEELTHNEDRRLIEFGVGLTDIVKRPTRSEEELSREEFAEGRVVLSQKLEQFAPRVVALIELDEGLRLVSNLAGIDPADVRNGMRVRVEFGEIDGVKLPQFRPVRRGLS